MNDFGIFLYVAAAGFSASLCSIPLLMRLARALKIVDRPAHRKIHTEPIPYLGGVGIFIGFAACAVLLFITPGMRAADTAKAITLVTASLAAFLLGLADDKLNFRARYKLLGQIFIAAFFTYFGYQFEVVTLPGTLQLNLYYLSAPLTIFWILAVVNSINLIDGVDGLAASVVSIILGFIALMAFYLQDRLVCILALGGLTATLAFLAFNWRPARIYMGDAGSLGLGMLIACSLVSLGKDIPLMLIKEFLYRSPGEPILYHVALASAFVAYPFMELSLTVVRRFLQGKSIGVADKGHMHHRLISRGWRADQICLAAVLISLIFGGAASYTLLQFRGVAAWFLACGSLLAGILLHFSGMLDLLRPQFLGARPHFLLANHFIAMQRIKLDFVEDVAELNALLTQTCLEFGIEQFTMNVAPGPGQTEPSKFEWKRSVDAQAVMIPPGSAPRGKTNTMFRDQVQIENSVTSAEWIFEPTAIEEDIDVEYRVLMSEFMRRALFRAEALYQALDPAELKLTVNSARPVSSLQLRRRSTVQRPTSAVPEKRAQIPPAENDAPPATARNI